MEAQFFLGLPPLADGEDEERRAEDEQRAAQHRGLLARGCHPYHRHREEKEKALRDIS